MFPEVGSKVDFVALEQDILSFWRERQIFRRSVQIREGGIPYVFYEGPPTANGSPGVHHVLSRLYKDVVCRYRTMKGYYVPRRAGWDTHGLPVELEVERSLGLTSKAQIEEFGIARFNERCRQSVLSYIKEWEAMTERLGCWLDMEHAYITMDNSYIESCWWIIRELWDKDLIYSSYKVTPHCPRCGTSLSSHEVALGYKEAEDPSVYVKFRVPEKVVREYLYKYGADPHLPAYLLAWTTTPWTLPGNTALAVAPDAEYALVRVNLEGGSEQFILAEALLGSALVHDYQILGSCKGKELAGERIPGKGVEYEPLYRLPNELYRKFGGAEWGGAKGEELPIYVSGTLVKKAPALGENFWLISAEFVSLDEGTGIVHVAPAFGEVDYEAGYSQGLYFLQPVNEQGIMIGDPRFAGKFVKDADADILEELRLRNLLYRSDRIVHTYPFCWRCDSPLLYYAKPAWYIKTTARKKELLSNNAGINWYPEHIKHGRFGNWLENNVDWAFSRERYWGTPLNIWRCSECGNCECIGSLEELRLRADAGTLPATLDLHRPYVDEITFACSKCGNVMRRVPEVIDCWFDSGAMPVAQWHYPFENREEFWRNFPADFICEAIDQTRGWFYSLHAISTLLFGRACFKNVICLGHVVDSHGEKMSKSKGNVIDPWSVFNGYGADALRWYMLVSTSGEDSHRFSTKALEETVRRFFLTLWNVYSFFALYANIDRFVPQRVQNFELMSLTQLDRWIISELNRLVKEVSALMDKYDLTSATRKIEEFVDNLSNWYVRRNRRRFWKSENDADKLAAHTTLYHCLVTLSAVLAPFVPFVAEALYRNLVRSVDPQARESVHLTDFPSADESRIDEKLSSDVELAREICSLGRAARAKAGIKVRQPLKEAIVVVETGREKEALQNLANEIAEEINVKQLTLLLSRSNSFSSDTPGYSIASDGRHTVAVRTELCPDLIAEGISRDLVRHIQNMRRNAGFDIADRIVVYYRTGEPLIKQAMHAFASYIKQETLCEEIVEGLPLSPEAHSETHRVANSDVTIAITKK
jgi:isoleucyl-tRNA synthetase